MPPEAPGTSGLSEIFDSPAPGQGAPASKKTPPWPDSPDAFGGVPTANPDISDAGIVAPTTHTPSEYESAFWRFAPAFTPAGKWPGRPPDAAIDIEPTGGTQAAAHAPAAAPAPGALRPPGGDPVILLFDMPPPHGGATGEFETYCTARRVGGIFDTHPGPHSLACRNLSSGLRAHWCWIHGASASDGHRFASLVEPALGRPVRSRLVRTTALRCDATAQQLSGSACAARLTAYRRA